MTATVQSRLQVSELTALARQALGKPSVEMVDWQCQRLVAGGSEYAAGGLGLYRITGTARDKDGSYPWSLILKITGGSGTGSQQPSEWNYWKREVLAYQSGLLDNLPGSLTAPRCYGVVEYPGDEFWMWLEDVRETDPVWTMERHGLAARHLGEFNGAYLAGYPLPEAQPWFSGGRVREWITFAQQYIEPSRQNAETPLGRRLFPGDSFERTLKVLENHQPLLEAFERLPVCFCHHDAFRRNLLARQSEAGASSTVAIDWAIMGFGRVGEEIGVTTANNLVWLEVTTSKAKELDQTVFSGYIEGLRAAGWKGDARLARLGYSVNAVVVTGLAWSLFGLSNVQNPSWAGDGERIIGHPIDDIIEAGAAARLFFLDLADEAYKLAEALA